MDRDKLDRKRTECRAPLGYRLWDELRSDLRFAVRSLRTHLGYSATAIAIVALAIGVNSAFFTLFSHYVLKPLPIRGAERHFDLRGLDRRARLTGGWTAMEIDAFRQASRQQVEGLYTVRTIQVLVLEPAQRLGVVSFVSDNYFRLLGGSAAIGGLSPSRSGASQSSCSATPASAVTSRTIRRRSARGCAFEPLSLR